MGLFDLFKKVPRIQDPLFGEMRYEVGFASGNTRFEPADKDVEVLVDCATDGPTQAQRDFFQKLQRDYPMLSSTCAEMITTEFRNWKEDFTIRDFPAEFTLVCIHIPENPDDKSEWTMSFTSIHDLNHHFEVAFIGDQAQHVQIDG